MGSEKLQSNFIINIGTDTYVFKSTISEINANTNYCKKKHGNNI